MSMEGEGSSGNQIDIFPAADYESVTYMQFIIIIIRSSASDLH